MSSLLRIRHFRCFHYFIVITHYYRYYPLLNVTDWATCRCWSGLPRASGPEKDLALSYFKIQNGTLLQVFTRHHGPAHPSRRNTHTYKTHTHTHTHTTPAVRTRSVLPAPPPCRGRLPCSRRCSPSICGAPRRGRRMSALGRLCVSL